MYSVKCYNKSLKQTDKEKEWNPSGTQIIKTTAYSATATDPNTEKVIEAAPLPDGAGASAGGEEIEAGELAGDGEVEGEEEGGDGGDFKEEGVGATAGEDLGELWDGALEGDLVGDNEGDAAGD